ncbi:MAG: hypothetical protein M3494_18935 [Actinomycetota bacterium]|jgi:hypothetical protein|nr:hypothetical protein [Rubrobacter sp.]MDQ3510049.1 hypothetical protein [Actinomycetota bacterium]
MHDFMTTGMEKERRRRLLDEARTNRMGKSLRERSSGVAESKITAFAKDLGRDAKAVISRLRGDRSATKERKNNV